MRTARILGRCLVPVGAAVALALWAAPARAQIDKTVVVGITPTCPYGLEGCWGGAYEALMHIKDVESVATRPDVSTCTGTVRLKGNVLPDPEAWKEAFHEMVGEAYEFRGIEVTAVGTVEGDDGRLVLRVPGVGQPIALRPFERKLQWNRKEDVPRQAVADERDAYQQLGAKVKVAKAVGMRVRVTGPLRKSGREYVLEVREYSAQARDAVPGRQG
jgi:hypothetical protein